MVESINVTFDDTNCTEQRSLPSAPHQSHQLLEVAVDQQEPVPHQEVLRGPDLLPSVANSTDVSQLSPRPSPVASPAPSSSRSPYVPDHSPFGSWSPHISISPLNSTAVGSPAISENPVYQNRGMSTSI